MSVDIMTRNAAVGIIDEASDSTASYELCMEDIERLLGGTQRRLAFEVWVLEQEHTYFPSTAEARLRIQAGVQKLDALWGRDWWQHIDVRRLNISSVKWCVLGQLYGNYYRAPLLEEDMPAPVDDLLGHPALHAWYKEAARCGFSLSHSAATNLWREAIAQVRQERTSLVKEVCVAGV